MKTRRIESYWASLKLSFSIPTSSSRMTSTEGFMSSSPLAALSFSANQLVALSEGASAKERAQRLGNSKVALQRSVLARDLVLFAHEVGLPTFISDFLPILRRLAADSDVSVRTELVQQFGDLAGFLIQADPEYGYTKVVEILFPMIRHFFHDSSPEVRSLASTALIILASHLRPNERAHLILPAALTLAHEPDDEEKRAAAAGILNGIAETLGQDLAYQFLAPELRCLAEDPSPLVRQSAAANFSEVCRIVGVDVVRKQLMLPFKKLARDRDPDVRRVAAHHLVNISETLPLDMKALQVAELFRSFLEDENSSVRLAAQEHLGQFLTSLRGSENEVLPLTESVGINENHSALLNGCGDDSVPLCYPTDLLDIFLNMANVDKEEGRHRHRQHSSSDCSSCSLPLHLSFLTTSTPVSHSLSPERSSLDDSFSSLFCSFSFAAVLASVGPSEWPRFCGPLIALVRDPSPSVRKCIAASFHLIVETLLQPSPSDQTPSSSKIIRRPPLSEPTPSHPALMKISGSWDASLHSLISPRRTSISSMKSLVESPSRRKTFGDEIFYSKEGEVREKSPMDCFVNSNVPLGSGGDPLTPGGSYRFHSPRPREELLLPLAAGRQYRSSESSSRDTSTDNTSSVCDLLLGLYEELLWDPSTDVMVAALKHLVSVLRWTPQHVWLPFLRKLDEIRDRASVDWRLRNVTASQLEPLCLVMKNEVLVRQEVVPLAVRLMEDPVATVRSAAVAAAPALLRAACPLLLKYFHEGGYVEGPLPTKEAILNIQALALPVRRDDMDANSAPLCPPLLRRGEEIAIIWLLLRMFARSSTFRGRVSFVKMCDKFLRELPLPMVELYFLRSLARLSCDPVRNVRVVWATVMAPHLSQGRLSTNSLMVTAARSLLLSPTTDWETHRILSSTQINKGPNFEGEGNQSSLTFIDGLEIEDLETPAFPGGEFADSSLNKLISTILSPRNSPILPSCDTLDLVGEGGSIASQGSQGGGRARSGSVTSSTPLAPLPSLHPLLNKDIKELRRPPSPRPQLRSS